MSSLLGSILSTPKIILKSIREVLLLTINYRFMEVTSYSTIITVQGHTQCYGQTIHKVGIIDWLYLKSNGSLKDKSVNHEDVHKVLRKFRIF